MESEAPQEIQYADLYVILHPTISGWHVSGEAKACLYYAQGLDRAAAFTKERADYIAGICGGIVEPIEKVKGQFLNADGNWIPNGES
jgi:hypothetical protein